MTAEALRKTISLESAADAVSSGNSTMNVQEALRRFCCGRAATMTTAPGDHGRPRRLDDLLGLLRNPVVTDVLRSSALHLWGPLDEGWDPWLRTRFKAR